MKKEINLLPDRYKRDLEKVKLKKVKVFGLIFFLVVFFIALYVPHIYIEKLKVKSVAIETEIINKEEIIEYRNLQEELLKNIEKRNEILKSLKSSSLQWTKIINSISQKIPDGLNLISISSKDTNKIIIIGKSENYNLVAQFLVNLYNLEIFKEANPLNIIKQDEDSYCEFTIECVIGGNN